MALQKEFDSTHAAARDSAGDSSFETVGQGQPAQHDLRHFLDNLGNPVLLLDEAARIEYVNPSFTSAIGLKNELLQGRPMEEIVHPRDIRKYHGWMDILRQGHKARSIHLCIRDNAEKERNFDVQALSTRSGEDPVQIQVILYEVSGGPEVLFQDGSYSDVLAEYEQVLGQSDATPGQALYIQDKLAGLGHLAAGIAHELRNPLSTLGTSVYFLSKVIEASENESIRDHLRIMQSEIERSQLIISNLVDFSRRSSTERESTDINTLIRKTLSLIEKNLAYQDVEVRLSLGGVPNCFINVDEIKQVLLDLIVNSMDAMPNGGCLSIESRLKGGSRVAIRISDNGIGIDPDRLGQIFNPFYSTKMDGGIGLGLSLVHSCIQRNHGSIEVESARGKGSQFTVFLPVID